MSISVRLRQLLSRCVSFFYGVQASPRSRNVLPASLIERLEIRVCLSAVSWDGGGDGLRWTDARNWSADVLPTAADDVSINLGTTSVQFDAGTHSVRSLVAMNPLVLQGGELTIGATFDIHNTVTLRGATIRGGNLNEIGTGRLTLTASGGTLDGITLNGPFELSTFRAKATIKNGISLNGTATFGQDALLLFDGTQTIDGNAILNFQNHPGSTNGLVASTDGMTLTIGTNVVLKGGNSDIGGTTIGYNPFVAGGTNTSIVNRGTIQPDIANGRIVIRPRGTGTFTNQGTIDVKGGVLDLNGDYSLSTLGTVKKSSGTIRLFGTLDISNATWNLADYGGSWTLFGGTIKGGVINQGPEAKLLLSAGNGTLDGVTINGPLEMLEFRSKATVLNGFILNGTATMGRDAVLSFAGTQSIEGNATFVFQDQPGATNGLVASADNMTLTIGERVTIRGGNTDSDGTTLGYNPFVPGGTNTSIINRGTIIADVEGGRMVIRPRGTGTFTNLGTLLVQGGTLDLEGYLTRTTLGSLTATSGTVRLFGTLDLNSEVLNIDEMGGIWSLQGGTIIGGVINGSEHAYFRLSAAGGILDGVTFNSPLEVTVFRARATIQNGLTLNGTATMGADGLLFFNGTQTLGGHATFDFQSHPGATNGLVASTDGMTLTVGKDVTLRGGNADFGGTTIGYNQFTPGGTNTSIVNQGTVIADNPHGRIVIIPRGTGTFTNLGVLRVEADATLEITASLPIPGTQPVTVVKTGTLKVGGSLLVTASATVLTELAGNIELNGAGTSTSPQLLEVYSRDSGLNHGAFFDNSALNSLKLANGTYVKLVDQSDNVAGSSLEALYAQSISIPRGTTLDLNGLNVYTTSLQLLGTVVNGTIQHIDPIPRLTLGQAVNGTISTAQDKIYQIEIEPGLRPEVILEGLPITGTVEIYVKQNNLPTRTSFDFSSTLPFASTQSITIPSQSSASTYYILITAPTLTTTESTFKLTVSAPVFKVRTIDFGTAGNNGDFTLQAYGANFTQGVTVKLSGARGFQLSASNCLRASDSEFYATFNLRGVLPGKYTVTFTNENSVNVRLSDSLTVVASTTSEPVIPRVLAPSAIRRDREFSFTVEWTNESKNDAIIPLLTVGSTVPFGLEHGNYSLGTRYTFSGLNTSGGPSGIIRPGQTQSLTFWGYSNNEPGEYRIYVDRNGKDPGAQFDWDSIRTEIRPAGMSDTEFEPIFTQLRNQVGPTWGDYLDMLSRNAGLVTSQDGNKYDPVTLTGFEIRKARAALATSISGKAVISDRGTTLAGLTISAENQTTKETFAVTIQTDGSFTFESVTPGSYIFRGANFVVVRSPVEPLVVAAGAHVTNISLQIEKGATIAGRALENESNEPVADARLLAFSAGELVAFTTTDSRGNYTFSGLAAGDYTFEINAEGRARTWKNQVVGSSSNVLDFKMTAESTLFATVQFSTVPAETVFVMAIRNGDSVDRSFFAAVQDNQFQLSGLPSGSYTVSIIVGESVTRVSNVGVGDGVTLNLGTINAFSSEPGEVADTSAFTVSFDPVLEAQITAAQIYLQTAFIPMITVRFGLSVGWLWNAFLNSSPRTPTSEQYYGGGSGLVEGSTFENGYRQDPQIQNYINQLLGEAAGKLRDKFVSGELTCENFDAGGRRSFPLSTLFESIELKPHLNFNDAFSIPGNTAGGMGAWNDRVRAMTRLDQREFSGDVIARIVNGNTLEVESRIQVTIRDAIDFEPGDLGDSIELVFTVPLDFLENQGRAYGVPYVVQFYDLMGRVTTVSIPKQDCLPDPEPENPDSAVQVQRPVSRDPNDIIGPAGIAPLNHILGEGVLPYLIRFENDKNAAAPAASVTITQTLDNDLDWTSFRLGDLAFGSTVVSVPLNTSFFETRVDLRTSRGVYVDIKAGIDISTGLVRWDFVSIDPVTGTLPENPLIGFLPPNMTGPEGEGFVNYFIRSKTSLVTGDRIDAMASIVFDVNEAIVTPPIFHTIDQGQPTSHVLPLPSVSTTSEFTINWEGTDDDGGVGIAYYDVYVSDNGGPFVIWKSRVTGTSDKYRGSAGHTYSFYSVAVDKIGFSEAAPSVGDTSIRLEVNAEPFINGAGVVNYNKNQPAVAVFPTIDFTDDDENLGGGSLRLSFTLAVSGKKKKNLDNLNTDSLNAIGVATSETDDTGLTNLNLQLNGNVTSTQIEQAIQLIQFSTKGKGLKTPTRIFQVQIVDQAVGTSNLLTQTIQISKKKLKLKPIRNHSRGVFLGVLGQNASEHSSW